VESVDSNRISSESSLEEPKNQSLPSVPTYTDGGFNEHEVKLYEGISRFNQKYNLGIKYLLAEGIIEDDPICIAKFLNTHNENLSKSQLGEVISESNAILSAFTDLMNFDSITFDQALRFYITKFLLPGEAQKIDRIMEVFAIKYCHDNPDFFPNSDTAFVLAFALIMLNTDIHNPAIAEKDKMTKNQFIRNLSGTWNQHDPPEDYIGELYDQILFEEILMKSKDDPDKKGLVKSVKSTGYEKGRCWMCLVGNTLRWYKNPSLDKGGKLLGMMKLDYVRVRELDDSFVITSSLPTNISFMVYEKEKNFAISSADLVVTCESIHHMEQWAITIRKNVSFENLPTFDREKDFNYKIMKTSTFNKYHKKPTKF